VAVTHPPWFDPEMPRREDCVLKAILDDRAARVPERRLALFEDGTQWTWREGREQARAQAAAIEWSHGCRMGQRSFAPGLQSTISAQCSYR
jgi:acyl-CoA synthetase (AMP-forming)/AMP-acid ligase II